MEYSASEMAWSPDSQFLLMRNKIFNLDGEQVSPDYPGRVSWLPAQAQLLVNASHGFRLTTISGEKIATISNGFASAWVFSHDS